MTAWQLRFVVPLVAPTAALMVELPAPTHVAFCGLEAAPIVAAPRLPLVHTVAVPCEAEVQLAVELSE